MHLPKEQGGISQPIGCGAFPNYFADASYGFGPNPKKSDEAVRLWCRETATILRERRSRSGAIQYQDKRTWTRSLYRCSLSKRPKVRIVNDYPYPLNALRAQFHLPVIERISSGRNCSFLALMCFTTFQIYAHDFAPTFGFEIQTHDV